jgi:hypothetical protein
MAHWFFWPLSLNKHEVIPCGGFKAPEPIRPSSPCFDRFGEEHHLYDIGILIGKVKQHRLRHGFFSDFKFARSDPKSGNGGPSLLSKETSDNRLGMERCKTGSMWTSHSAPISA